MDPTNQQPGQPTPPWGADPQPEAPEPGQPASPWGPDPQPEAPQPGQPTPPWAPADQPAPWGAPAEPAAPWAPVPPPEPPQPGQPTPPWAPADQPAPWGAPGQPGAPQPYYVPGQPWPQVPQKSGGRGKRIAAIVIVAVVVIGGLYAFLALQGLADRGKVVFSIDAPASEPKGCQVSNQVTTVTASTSVYPTFIYTGTIGSDVVTLAISKDGVEVGTSAVPTADTSGADCTTYSSDLSSLSGWGPGKWTFTLTASGKTVSEGTLTVTP